MKKLLIALAIMFSAACDVPKQIASFSSPSSVVPSSQNLTVILGAWTGATTSNNDQGPLTAIFDTAQDPTQSLSIRLIFFSNSLQAAFRGTCSGPLNNLNCQADAENPTYGTHCGYHATAGLNTGQGENEIRGSYYGTPSDNPICAAKSGTFILHRTGEAVCVGADHLGFNPPNNAMANFPVGYPNPFLPTVLGIFPFTAEKGNSHWEVRTGHYTYPDINNENEILLIEPIGDSGVIAQLLTKDVPEDKPNHTTTFDNIFLREKVKSIRISHGFNGVVTMPDNSVTIEFVLYRCS